MTATDATADVDADADASASARRGDAATTMDARDAATTMDARDARDVANVARADARMARGRVATLKLEARAREATVAALRAETETLRKENRALRHARVRATVEATTSTSTSTMERAPETCSAALARAWGALGARAAKGAADVGLLMRQYKETRRERARAFDKIVALEAELADARARVRTLETREKERARVYTMAEAIVDEEADEKLTLRRRLTEALGERAALRVECDAQRETIENMRANERRLRDDALKLEKRLVRAANARETYRKLARDLEASERESAERGERLALVEAECVTLAEMVREMNKLSGVDPREFMVVAERALLGADGVARATASPARSPAASDIGYATPEDDDAGVVDDDVHDARALSDDDDFPSPPVSGIVQRGTPDSAGSDAFHF